MDRDELIIKFLEDNITLLEQEQFLDVFERCPLHLREQLLKTLESAEIDIVDNGQHYYGFKERGNSGVGVISKYNQKNGLYDYTFMKNSSGGPLVKTRMLVTDDLKRALEFAAYTYTNPVMLDSAVINSLNIVPIKVSFKVGSIDMFVSQEGVDFFDPVKSKERRFQSAAKEELDNRLMEYVRKVVNTERLHDNLVPLTDTQNTYRLSIYVHPAELLIDFEDNSYVDKPAAESVIRKEVNSPVEILWEDDVTPHIQASVKLKSSRIDTIKKEVEDLFGVKF